MVSSADKLRGDRFFGIHKNLIKEWGFERAGLLSELAEIEGCCIAEGTLDEEGWFYATIEKIQQDTCLSKDKQAVHIQFFKELGILEQKLAGVPCKRYFRIIDEALDEVLEEINNKFVKYSKTRLRKSRKLSYENLANKPAENSQSYIYKTINNENINNTIPKEVGEFSQKTIILEEKNQKSKSGKICPPPATLHVTPVSYFERKTKTKLLSIKDERTKRSLINYLMYLKDDYNFKDTALANRIDDIMRKACNVPDAVEAICDYNINGNYRILYTPKDLKSIITKHSAISQPISVEEGDPFVRDENGDIEIIW